MDPHFGTVGAQNSNCTKCSEIEGYVDDEIIAGNFAKYFSEIYTPNSAQRASSLYKEFSHARKKIISALHSLMTGCLIQN